MPDDTVSEPIGSRRLVFDYEGGAFRLISDKHVDMTPIPGPAQEPVAATGFRYELLDDKGTVLYRDSISSPFRGSVEVRTGNPKQPLAQRTVDPKLVRGKFVLTVPDFRDTAQLVVFDLPPRPEASPEGERPQVEKGGEQAIETFRIQLEQLGGEKNG